MFKRIAVVNRGEAAVRLIRAVKELNAEYDYGIRTVALHTDSERASEFETIHNIQRAQQVGSVHHIVPAAELRPQIIAAIERGITRAHP
ncbi:biotin carboxylase N-terminal domain-containing protein [Rhodococcus sp. KRD197]|uniref:biotin carboxylase N-terminal domain-containing protein n=1 Tax=Rhodococcus sp. KRD197 TaxID=2729731 RepID=UPI0019D10BA6|nr:biotin carboxylase N-terminal domain-containing protein [Rhodococcus sp. KRD197]